MGKCSNSLRSEETALIIWTMSYVRPFSMNHMQVWPINLSFRSFGVKCVFLPLIFDRIEIDQWGWVQCVSLAETHQLIYNRAYRVTSHDLNHGSIFYLDFLSSTCIFLRLLTTGTLGCPKYFTSFLIQRLFEKKRLSKTLFWTFLTALM